MALSLGYVATAPRPSLQVEGGGMELQQSTDVYVVTGLQPPHMLTPAEGLNAANS